MMRLLPVLSAAALALSATASGAPSANLSITRLDCGSILIKDFDAFFSDAGGLPKGPRRVTDSCYLIRHGDQYLLWDTGLPAALKGKSNDSPELTASLGKTIVEQLAVLGLKPTQINFVGISHKHFDHVSQAAGFPGATLVIGGKDFDSTKGEGDPFGPWRARGAKVKRVDDADLDLFGDRRVRVLRTPGHTNGHLSLLVELASGPLLLTGDLYHSDIAARIHSVPPFNEDRADTLASMDRFDTLAKNRKARVIIQHEPNDIAKLPAFPKAAQ